MCCVASSSCCSLVFETTIDAMKDRAEVIYIIFYKRKKIERVDSSDIQIYN